MKTGDTKNMGLVGIFWYIDETLIFKAISPKELGIDSIGKIDSPFKHVDEWETYQIFNKFSLPLSDTEYQSFPRGRVVFSQKMSEFHVFIDKSIFKKIVKNKIIDSFELEEEQTRWFEDPHYKIF